MSRLALLFCFLSAARLVAAPPGWQQQLTSDSGSFPLPRPFHAVYRFGWGSVSAAEANVDFSPANARECQLTIEGKTIGLARTLWRLDTTHVALANGETLGPIKLRQTEVYRSETVRTELDFDGGGVTKFRETKPPEKTPPKRKRFKYPQVFDIHSALLFIRSQKLGRGETYRVVVYPTTAPYLATAKVLGREKIQVKAGKFNAIRIELKLNRINRKYELEAHSKFKRAYAWISDDPDRLILKIDAEIFVGSVWAELEKVSFDAP